MLNREIAIHERAVRCQTLEIRKGYIPRRRTTLLFPMGFPIKTMGFPIKTMGFPIIYRIYRSSDPSTFVETGLTGWDFLWNMGSLLDGKHGVFATTKLLKHVHTTKKQSKALSFLFISKVKISVSISILDLKEVEIAWWKTVPWTRFFFL